MYITTRIAVVMAIIIIFHHGIAIDRAHFIGHVQVLQELKERFTAQAEILPKKSNTKKTPTQAYLKVRAGSDWIWQRVEQFQQQYKPLVKQIIQREKEFADTHYALYHAHTINMMLLHDVIKEVNSYLHIVGRPSYFNFLRFKELQQVEYPSANDYLKDHFLPLRENDDMAAIAAQVMSVNLSLFGNMAYSGECTFDYFVNNRSIRYGDIDDKLTAIFDYYQFDHKYIKELEKLTVHLASKTGNLLQIFIPKKLVDQFVYLAKPMGYPDDRVILKKYFDTSLNRHTKISPILDYYCRKPHKIANIDELQARIVFLSPMFDPASGIKMFRYNTIAPEDMRTYEQKLRDIVARMMSDYVKRHKDRHNTSQLFRLRKFVVQGQSISYFI